MSYISMGISGSTLDSLTITDLTVTSTLTLTGATADTLDVSGSISVGTTLDMPAGTAAAPSLIFASQTGLGIYRPAANSLGFTTGSSAVALILNRYDVSSGAGATLDRIDFPATTCLISGSTNITTATGFNNINIDAPVYSAAQALTITVAANVYIAGPPTGGGVGPATITTAYSLWVDSGASRFDGTVFLDSGTVSVPSITFNAGVGFYSPSADTMAFVTASSREALRINRADVTAAASLNMKRLLVPATTYPISGGTNVTTATGCNVVEISTPTYSNAAITMDYAANLYIANEVQVTGGMSLTNSYALWVDAGLSRFDGNSTHVFELPADATDPTGGGGAAAGRIPVKIGGATKYLAYY